MKRSLFTIFIITISIALFSVCVVTAADADNIDLGDSDFESGFLLVDYSIESTQQELENKPVDITGHYNGDYIKNMENEPRYSIYAEEARKAAEEILSQYMHNDSGFKSNSRVSFVDYSIESTQQELENKSVDTISNDGGNYIQNMKDTKINEQLEKRFSNYKHLDLNNPSFSLKSIHQPRNPGITVDLDARFHELSPIGEGKYPTLEELISILNQTSSSNSMK